MVLGLALLASCHASGSRARTAGHGVPIMRVEFERSGGFAGLRTAATIDSASLAPDDARKLQELVDASGFFDLPAKMESPSPGADRFQYRIAITSGSRSHTVEASEEAFPAKVKPLIQWLTKAAAQR
jgi:hypothetical protein